MKTNMGMIDRVMRLVIAIAIAVLYFTGIINGTTAIVLLVVGGVFLLTSLVGFCPLYFPFHISTKKKAEKK